MIWVRMMGSKFQVKFFNYKIEVQGLENKVFYEGPVRHIGEKNLDIFKSQIGLSIPFAIIKKCLKEDRLHFSIEIRNMNNQSPLAKFEGENCEEKPLKKKIKIENENENVE